MLYRYTLLLYGTAEDMTARPPGPQVTSSLCVRRDTEGLCQGECRHGREVEAATAGTVPVASEGRWWATGLGWQVHGFHVSCGDPTYLLGQFCLAHCPPRFFNHTRLVTARPGHPAAPALRVCSSCHASCYTCRGSSPRDCTSCPPSYTLDQQQGSCLGPTTPDSHRQLRGAACPYHRCPALAMVLGLLAVTLGGPILCGMSTDRPP
ncbi:Proprotein convertase subtilisin/kexin type 4 [Saguinus oedipus]|uniref:Proprotein convertase subtilisin/kexin type 4 n=1 Tax=Saguinus oedipus TaxID=9490 RepID=A0ABQ9TQ10_SAGOE|nr:Proprotein convertase subtilisin/kexin type 4 [Saguinus oedipus]